MAGGRDVDEILVAADAAIWTAPLTATRPTDLDTAMASVDDEWVDVGWIDENGITLARARTINPVPVMQSRYPARRLVAEEDLTVAFAMRQWDKTTAPLAFGGGTVESTVAGVYKYTPPTEGEVDTRQLCVEWEDGDKKYRFIIPRGEVGETADTVLNRTEASNLGVTFGITPDGTLDPFYWLTNDVSFDPLGS
jgi:hypothetical protein